MYQKILNYHLEKQRNLKATKIMLIKFYIYHIISKTIKLKGYNYNNYETNNVNRKQTCNVFDKN